MICFVCGRRLRDPESIKNGIGPVCYERMYGKKKKGPANVMSTKTEDSDNEPLPGQMDITMFLDNA